MTGEGLTSILAERMGWRLGPDRFLTSRRGWIPLWRFQPLTNIEDAFQLLNVVAGSLVLTTARDGSYTAQVKVGHRTGCASTPYAATSITVAVARAMGLDIPDGAVSSLATNHPQSKREGPCR